MNLTKIISGEMYYYIDSAYVGMLTHVKLAEKVDGTILKQALDKTQKVHPYLTWTVEEKAGEFYYKDTGIDATLIQGEVYPSLGSDKVDDHLAAIIYFDNTICLDMFHGLIDGVSVRHILETLVYFYFCIKDNKEYDATGIMTKAAGEYKTIFAEPYENRFEIEDMEAIEKEIATENAKVSDQIFSFSEVGGNNGEENVIQCVKIPNDQFMEYSKSNHMSPSIALSLLVCNTIQSIYPDNTKQIKINIPVSLRDALGVPETFRNTTGDVAIYYDPVAMADMSLEETGNLLRQELKRKMAPNRQKLMADQSIDFLKMTAGYTDFNSKYEFYKNLPLPASDTFFISYMGKFQAAEYEDQILECIPIGLPRDGLVFNIYDCGGNFNIILTKKGTDTEFCDALINEAKKNNMDASLTYQKSYDLEYVSLRETLGLL